MWERDALQAALRPLVAAAAARDGYTVAQARQRALLWLGVQLRLPAAPASLGDLGDLGNPQLRLVVVACTRPLGLPWEPCHSCGEPALPSCTLEAERAALQLLRAQLTSLQCVGCCPGPERVAPG